MASVLHIFTLGEEERGRGVGGLTQSREHYSDARGATRQSTLNRGAGWGVKKVWVVRESTCETLV